MAKGLKIAFALSLFLNIGLIAGFLYYRSYTRRQMFEGVAMSAEAEGRLLQSILSDIESGDPARMEALTEKLKASIDNADKAVALWRQAAQ